MDDARPLYETSCQAAISLMVAMAGVERKPEYLLPKSALNEIAREHNSIFPLNNELKRLYSELTEQV